MVNRCFDQTLDKPITVGIWWRSLRTYAFVATIIPLVCAALIGARVDGLQIDLFATGVMLLSALLLHAGTNVLNDYFDFTMGFDTAVSAGSSGLLVNGKASPAFFRISGIIYLTTAVLFGLILIWRRGLTMTLLGVIGLLGAIFYSHRYGYKYRGFGEIAVFILMGPILYCAAYLAATATLPWRSLLLSLPYACFVAAIMLVNNIRDYEIDRITGMRTLPHLIGVRKAKVLFTILMVTPYVLNLIFQYCKLWPRLTLITLLSLTANIPLVFRVFKSEATDSGMSHTPQKTALNYMLFGVLLIFGLVFS